MTARSFAVTPPKFTKSMLDEISQANPGISLVDQMFLLLADRMSSAQLSVGSRLPSVRTLAQECEVSSDTVARAYERLVAHGLVEARRGSGYFVRGTGRQAISQPIGKPVLSGPMSSGNTRWRSMLVKHDPALKSRTGSGAFPESWVSEELLASALRGVTRQSIKSVAHYSDLRGYLPLRQQLQVKLQEHGIFAEPDCILVTNGATEAIHLVIQTLLAGTRVPVLVDLPTPPLLTDRLLSTGAEIYPVKRQADGPDLDEMRTLCEKFKPRAFITSSVLHNPTGTNIAPHKAFQILRLAEEFNFFLVEDDTYGDLMPKASAVPISRLATLDQLKRVIYIGSFSKTLGPGLRLGYLTASAERIDWLTTYRMVQTVSGSTLAERVLYKALSGGDYRRHCEQLRNRLAEVRPVVVDEVRRWGLTVDHVPDAGLYLWASLGEGADALQIAESMLEQGHLIAPAQAFMHASRTESGIRINIAEAFESTMLPALGRLLGRSPRQK